MFFEKTRLVRSFYEDGICCTVVGLLIVETQDDIYVFVFFDCGLQPLKEINPD